MGTQVLDLFCGAGGACLGMYLADPTVKVTGIDIKPQPNYKYGTFIQEDVKNLKPEDLEPYDFIWASPPCQKFSIGTHDTTKHEDLCAFTRDLIKNKTHVIENVNRAPIRCDLLLCGSMFNLKIRRHRRFEIQGFVVSALYHPPCNNRGIVTVAGHGGNTSYRKDKWSQGMGIYHMTKDELREAVPPRYSEYIFNAYLSSLR